MRTFPLAKAFQLLEPGPTVLVTTAHKGRANVMSMSWHMALAFEPPLFACVIGPWDHSHKALRATGECVIAIPTVDLAEKVVGIGNCSGADVDKFARFGLTPLPAKRVRAPLIRECVAHLECRVFERIPRYNILVLEAVQAWHDPRRKEQRTLHHRGDGTFLVPGRTLDLKRKMVKW